MPVSRAAGTLSAFASSGSLPAPPSSSTAFIATDDSLSMPLYELFCVAAYSAQSGPLRTLLSNTSNTILSNGGVVRGMQYWGRRLLPQEMKRNQVTHTEGDYFIMQVDTNPTTLGQIKARMRSDPRVLHFTPLRLGRKVSEIVPPPFSARPGGPVGMGGKTIR